MAGNTSLNRAKAKKKDEFYTQLNDIQNELQHYSDYFKDKIVLCNCDDPYESNFFKYFALNFNELGLKKLICVGYEDSPFSGEQLNFFGDSKPAHVVEITEVKDFNEDGRTDLTDVEWLIKNNNNTIRELKGDGDFRNDESIELLKEADIVVTNPPFSLFREYIKQLMDYDKKFIIIGNKNAVTYKDIFPLIQNNKIWVGYGFPKDNAYFKISEENVSNYAKGVYNPETGLVKFRNCTWFTNLDIPKRHEDLVLYKKYNPEEYPNYDNYDAIEVSRTAEIPKDYNGIMGVPITFIDKYSPDQFNLIGLANHGSDSEFDLFKPILNGKEKFKRLLIKRK